MINDKKLPLKEKFLEYYRELPVQKLAGESIGKNEDTILLWKKQDSDFSDQIDIARAEWAKRMSKGVKSKEWLLERIMKDHFAQRNELTGKDGKDLPTPILNAVHTDNSNQEAVQSKKED